MPPRAKPRFKVEPIQIVKGNHENNRYIKDNRFSPNSTMIDAFNTKIPTPKLSLNTSSEEENSEVKQRMNMALQSDQQNITEPEMYDNANFDPPKTGEYGTIVHEQQTMVVNEKITIFDIDPTRNPNLRMKNS